MWGPDLKFSGVKSKRGEPINERVTAGSALSAAAHNRRHERGLYSLAISLLPFFKPSKASRDALENPEALTKTTDPKEYAALLKPEPIFSALANFCIITRFRVGGRVRSAIDDLANDFKDRSNPIQIVESGPVADFLSALQKFKPNVFDNATKKHVQIPAPEARALAPELLNVVLIHHARTINDDYDVTSCQKCLANCRIGSRRITAINMYPFSKPGLGSSQTDLKPPKGLIG